MYCDSCGKKLGQGARFCGSCGAVVEGVASAGDSRRPAPEAAPEPQPGPASNRSRIAIAVVAGVAVGLALVAAILGIASLRHAQTTVAVTIPLEVPDLDEDGTRVPVEATGTDADGNEVEVRAYLSPDGTGLELPLGSYEVRALGSPFSAKGVVYKVPKAVVEVTLDEEAVESGQTQSVSEPLTFKKVSRAKTTDEQIDDALEWASADEALAEGRAQELADAARTARDKAVQKAQKEADEKAEQEAKEAAEAAEREANTLRVGNIAFLVPEGWREGMSIDRSATDIHIKTASGTWTLTLDAGREVFSYITSTISPWRTIDLESGWRLSLYYGDDGAAIGEIADAQGTWICEMSTMKFDGNEFGGRSSVNSADGRAAQAAITNLDADADPEDLWVECLRVCAENVSLA